MREGSYSIAAVVFLTTLVAKPILCRDLRKRRVETENVVAFVAAVARQHLVWVCVVPTELAWILCL